MIFAHYSGSDILFVLAAFLAGPAALLASLILTFFGKDHCLAGCLMPVTAVLCVLGFIALGKFGISGNGLDALFLLSVIPATLLLANQLLRGKPPAIKKPDNLPAPQEPAGADKPDSEAPRGDSE